MTAPRTNLPDRAHRDAATADLDRSFSVEASAGTGKTAVLVERALNLIGEGRAEIHQVAIITFSEPAAAELEERIRTGLEDRIAEVARRAGGLEAAGKRWRSVGARKAQDRERDATETAALFTGSDEGAENDGLESRLRATPEDHDGVEDRTLARLLQARRDLDRATIQTIHAFAASLLRQRPVAAGVDPSFDVADEQTQRTLIDEEWGRYVIGRAATQDEILRRLLIANTKVDALRSLAERFLENRDLVARGLPGRSEPPDPLAHARALQAWIEQELEEARKGCRSDTDRMLEAIRAAAVQARAIARGSAKAARERLILEKPAPLSSRWGRQGFWREPALRRAQGLAKEWKERFGAYRERLGSHLAAEAGQWILGFLEAYERRKRKDGLLDFQDLLLRARDLLQRPGVASDLRDRYPYVLVDEFQDTDPLQVEIVALLTGAGDSPDWTSRRPQGGSLFLVGDPKQSIYRFRRADVAVYGRARRWLAESCGPEANLTISTNFRSAPGIAGWVNALFERLLREEGSSLETYVPLVPSRTEPAGAAVIYLAPDAALVEGAEDARRLEAAILASLVRERVATGRWRVTTREEPSGRSATYGDVVLLLRAFSDVALYEEAFREAGIRCLTAGGKLYFRRADVASFVSVLRAVECPHDEVAVVAALRSPIFGLSDESLVPGGQPRRRFDPLRPGASTGEATRALRTLAAWHESRNAAPVGTAVRALLEESGILVLAALRPDGEQSALNLLKIADLARRHEASGGSFRSFVQWLGRATRDALEEPDSPILESEDDAVRLMTIHAAKGLEFPIVILGDLARRPILREDFLVDREEGRIAYRLPAGPLDCRSSGYAFLLEAEKAQLRAERRRLLYVAATRARDLLILPLLKTDGNDSFVEDLRRGGALPAADGSRWVRAQGAVGDRFQGPSPPALEDRRRGAARDVGEGPSHGGALPTDRETELPNGARVHVENFPPAALSGGGGLSSLESGPPDEPPGPAGPAAAGDDRAREPATLGSLTDWEQARGALLERASRAPVYVTASRARDQDAEEEDLAASGSSLAASRDEVSGWRARRRERSRAFGLAVHAVLEALDLAAPADIESLAAAHAEAAGIVAEREAVAAAVRRALELPAVLRARACRSLRETPVTFAEGDVILEGQVDLVYEEDDGSLVVVDFKTDAVGADGAAARAEAYKVQLGLYAKALERATGRPVREMVLLFLSAGVEVRLLHDENVRALVASEIAAR